MSAGTSFRLPRKFKKLQHRLFANQPLNFKARRLLARALVFKSMGGWQAIRHHNAHVAMGDTSTLRHRERASLRNPWCSACYETEGHIVVVDTSRIRRRLCSECFRFLNSTNSLRRA